MIVVWRVSPDLGNDDYQSELAGEIVEMHMRSLQAGLSAEISSHDELVVREWVRHKVKFALPASDWRRNGFTPQGGRVEVVDGRRLTALVYAHEGRWSRSPSGPGESRTARHSKGPR